MSKAESSQSSRSKGKKTNSPATSHIEIDSASSRTLPFEGELHTSPHRKYGETIVFVHHFGGSKKSTLRHAKFVNDLGFDHARFTLSFNEALPSKLLPITADLKFGARHLWSNQIESVLNSIPGKKIVYSFSMPSNSALEAIARRQAKDVVGWVCDGGPFLDLPTCVWNLYENEYKVSSRLLRGLYTGVSLAVYGLGFPREVRTLLDRMPAGFPVLSIRGVLDPLVSPSAIEEVFAQQSHLNLESLLLKNSGHLDGLKKEPEAYTAAVEKFLRSIATPAHRATEAKQK